MDNTVKVIGHRVLRNMELLFEVLQINGNRKKHILMDITHIQIQTSYKDKLDEYLKEIEEEFLERYINSVEHSSNVEYPVFSTQMQYLVNAIIGRRRFYSEVKYLVLWGGAHRGSKTWKPLSCLGNCAAALYKFEKIGFGAAGGITPKFSQSVPPMIDLEPPIPTMPNFIKIENFEHTKPGASSLPVASCLLNENLTACPEIGNGNTVMLNVFESINWEDFF